MQRQVADNKPVVTAVNAVTWRIGGQQGEGIDSTSDIFAKAMARIGLHVYTYRSFSSRIKGGLTWSDVRVSDDAAGCRADTVEMVVALGQEVVDASLDILSDPGVILYDSDSFEPEIPKEHVDKVKLVGIPMTKIAQDNGSKIMRNTVSLGATARLLGIDRKVFFDFVQERFGHKGDKIVNMNKAVINAAFEATENALDGFQTPWSIEERPLPETGRRLVINGNHAASYGALVGGCRFVAGYPITPATDVLEWFIAHVGEYGGAVVQTEDEISAIHMVLGAGYAGVRATTSTSGPGLSLMTEGLGLAGAAEIPAVVIDVMRPGPSTGLPTKHGQTDLNFVVFGGHDEFPRIVLSPTTVEETFYLIQEAFNYAEEYQLPVFFLLDQDLGISFQTLEGLDVKRVPIRRGKLLKDEDLAAMSPDSYKRFQFTDDGVSPRAVPGQKNGIFLSTGSEHNEMSVVTENIQNRIHMVEKRLQKEKTFTERVLDAEDGSAVPPVHTWGPDDARVGIITWGSTRHPLEEALTRLEDTDGTKVKRMVLTHLWPFPAKQVKAFMDSVDTVVVVESNATGQLAGLMKREVGGHDKIKTILKWDGMPFRPIDILDQLNEVI